MAKQPDFDTELEEARTMNESQLALLNKANAKKAHFNKIINTSVEAGKALNDNDAFQIAKSTVWPWIKDQVRDFSAYSDHLLLALDELSRIHPFINDNDQKLFALHCTMSDMMSTLQLLKGVSSSTEVARDGMTIENRISERMRRIKESIHYSMQLSHSYTNLHTATKVLTSFKWQSEFTKVTEELPHIGKDCGMRSSYTQASTSSLTSQEERDMDEFIKKNGGVEVVSQNPNLLDTPLRCLQRRAPDMPEKRQKDDSGIDMPGKRRRDDPGMTVTKLQEQLRAEVEVIIKENSKAFEQQCEVLRIQIDEVKGIVKRESKRTIHAIHEGAHDRIRDPDICVVWKDMNVQSSVNGKKEINTISQIRDIVDPSNVKPAEGKLEEIASVTNRVETIRPEDEWALGYISVLKVQPLMEAPDRDASSFVTVVEANAFAADRPLQWTSSLAFPIGLHIGHTMWQGFELSVNWYRAHIIKLLAHISPAVNKTLPANRVTVEPFWQIHLLAGFYDGDIQDDIDIENDAQFLRFKDYILKQEASLRNMLSKTTYNLSDYDTFSIVLGQSRLETCILPLLHLLLQRALDILRISETVVLDDAELSIIDKSIYNVNRATYKRVNTLKDIFKLQNLDFKTQTKKFFLGCRLLKALQYYHYFEQDILNGYWKLSPDTNSVLGSLAEGGLPSEESEYENYSYAIDGRSNSPDGLKSTSPQCVATPTTESHGRSLDSTENDNAVRSRTLGDLTHIPSNGLIGSPSRTQPALVYGPSSEDSITVDNGSSDQTEPQPSDTSISSDSTHILLGQWYGLHPYNKVHLGQSSAGIMSFSVNSGYTDGRFSGSGVDGVGEFLIEGSLDTDGVKLIKTYVYLMGGTKMVLEYRRTLSADSEIMSGSWGLQRDDQPAGPITADSKSTTNDPPAPESTDDKTPLEDSTAYDDFQRGGFLLKRRHLFWPSDPELERRGKKRKCISLVIQKNMNWHGSLEDEDLKEWANLHQSTPPKDLQLWSAMATFAQRRRILHSSLFLGRFTAIIVQLIPLREQGEILGTLDLCFNCMDKPVYRGGEHSKTHHPLHPLLQVRRILPNRYGYDARNEALSLVQLVRGYTSQSEQTMALKAQEAPTCAQYHKPIKHPFWCCITCEERAKPWQWEYRPVSDLEHTLLS
ncbi:hypothetical protein BU17DRAFT_68621 [Hysterangium stoloniferum]|nr:hypothetical protein BU17DRAFT_68621 [Hysterangium stoloniferum]